jgi:hypothetical protein
MRTPRSLFAVTLSISVLCAAWSAVAMPRYSARYEQDCMLCHVNPTGGGMRSEYATKDIVPKELAMKGGEPEALALIDTHLGRNVTFGLDLRQAAFATPDEAGSGPPQGFFLMQSDVHLAFQLDPRLLVYYGHGQGGTGEAFALAHGLPHDGWVKVGRFVPTHGWRFDDHTMYVRSEEGFAPPNHLDTGFEVGFSTKHAEVVVGTVNGVRSSRSTFDDDRSPSSHGQASVRGRVGPAAVTLGGSYVLETGAEGDPTYSTVGGFGSFVVGPVTWVGQVDRMEHPLDTRTANALITSHEVSFALRRGVELLATYDFVDPDLDQRTGARSRIGGGVHLMPRPWCALEGVWRHVDVDAGPLAAGTPHDEAVLQLHLLY